MLCRKSCPVLLVWFHVWAGYEGRGGSMVLQTPLTSRKMSLCQALRDTIFTWAPSSPHVMPPRS